MGRDFYAVLELNRDATEMAIKKAYRKLALKFHPQKNPGDQEARDHFQLLAEAYDVLSDARKKAVYDQFGEEGLKTGIPLVKENGAWTQGYVFHGNPDKVFREFFGADNPFQEFYDRIDGDLSMGFGGLYGKGARVQDPPVENELQLSLEEIYHGCLKRMEITRRVMNEDGHTSSMKQKILVIKVHPGWTEGTAIRFPEEGSVGPNNIPADIVFIVKDKPHARFSRDADNNLIYLAPISLRHALTNLDERTLNITTLDERHLHIPINEVIYPGFEKRIPGEGMPIPGKSDVKGDLIIRFDIKFPKYLDAQQKEKIRQALPETF